MRTNHVPALAKALRQAVGKLGRRLKAQTVQGWSQVQVLGYLDRDGPSTASALARADGVRPQSMSATVATMEVAKLVRSAPDARDGRRILFSLTEAGRRMLKESRSAREDWLASALEQKFTRAEQAELARAVELLSRLTATAD